MTLLKTEKKAFYLTQCKPLFLKSQITIRRRTLKCIFLRVKENDYIMMAHLSEKYSLNDITSDFSGKILDFDEEIFKNMLYKNGRIELSRDDLSMCNKDRESFEVKLGKFILLKFESN